MVFARGSGQNPGGEERDRFNDQLETRLNNTQIDYSKYELGTSNYKGYQYPAIPIKDHFVKLRAKISSGYGYEYGDSVKKGVLELYHYLDRQQSHCPKTQYVLGGYSQGAQVMGQSLAILPKEIRDKIVFVALFGDPKLHLPEGRGWPTPACDNRDFSPWRRVVENCTTSAGILDARDPYVPDDMKDKVGLWCLAKDYICGSTNLPWELSGHEEYKNPNGPIDQAAREVAQKLKTVFTYQSHLGKINTAPHADQKPKVDVQVLFIVDRTVNMQHDYPNYFLPKMRKLVESLPSNVAIGFDYYLGCWRKDDPARYDWALIVPHFMRDYDVVEGWIERSATETTWMNSDTIGSIANLPYFSIEPGCDLSWELGVHAWRAMADFIQSYNPIHLPDTSTLWVNNSRQRIIIPITNTPYTPNDTKFGENNGLFTQATTSPTQTTVIPLVPDSIRPTFKDLGDLDDNSQVFLTDDDQIAEIITEQFGTNSQIEARLTNTDYRLLPGTTATFDASRTVVNEDTIVKYEWDFNNDGSIDAVTTQPTTSHTYNSDPHNNIMRVTVTTESGLSDITTANVRIINPAEIPPKPNAPQSLSLEPTGVQSVKFSWRAGDNLADKYMVYLNDVPLGYTEKDQTSIEITDVRSDENTTFGVRAISSQYETSEMATITLPAQRSVFPQGNTIPSSSLSSTKISPASNLFEAMAQIFNVNNLRPATRDGQRFREPSFALVYYIVGGIIATGLIAFIARRIFLHLKNTRNSAQ
jgi:hypothetical protein